MSNLTIITMSKKPFEITTAKATTEIREHIGKAKADGTLGTLAVEHIKLSMIEEIKEKVKVITEKALEKITSLEKECKESAKITPKKIYNSSGVVGEAPFTEEEYKKKQKPYEALENLNTVFDKAIASGNYADFIGLEKLV